MHCFFSNNNLISEDLGYVEDRPFVNVNSSVVYPTWIKERGSFIFIRFFYFRLKGRSLKIKISYIGSIQLQNYLSP